ncbi:MAG: universal stress protein [Candidatus Muiribacteriota bacterium]
MYNILLAMDNSSYSKNALEMSVNVAREIGARINILYVIENKMLYHPFVPVVFNPVMDGYDLGDDYTKIYEQTRENIKKFGKKAIEEAEEYCKKNGVDHLCFMREGILSEEINSLAVDNDVVVMGIFGHSAKFTGGLLGSAVEEVVRTCNKPVLLAPDKVNNFKKIVVAFDNSKFSNKVLKLAFWMDKIWNHNLEFEIFTVVTNKEEQEKFNEIIDGLVSEKGENFKKRILLSENKVEMIINHSVESEADLLMMGAFGHGRIRELILGGTTSEIIRKIRIPVFLYR